MQQRQERYDAFVKDNSADIDALEQMLDSGGEHGGQIMVKKVRESDATLTVELARDKAVYQVLTSELPQKAFEAGGVDTMNDAEIATALNLVSGDFLTSKTTFDEVVASLSKLETKKANLETQFQPESYEIKSASDEIAALKRQLFGSVVGYAKNLAANIKAREMQIAMNKQLIETRTAEQSQLHKKFVDYTRLKNDFQVAQQHLDGLVKEKMSAMTNGLQANQVATIRKMDEASMPDKNHPASPQPVLYTIVAFLGSLLLAIMLAFFFNRFDHTMHSSFDAERYLGLPVLGSVKKRGRGLVVAA